jgi:adenine-specific DNA glycosylase
MGEYGGRLPDEYEELLTLSGIGSYTAGAIASIAYGKPVPAVDGNALRVISRIRMDEGLITEEKTKEKVRRDLREIMPGIRPGDFNQALMEVGACICIPSGVPHCGICPLSGLCLAHRSGRETEFPKRAARKQRAIEEKTILVILRGNRAAIRKRPDGGLLAGMYEFPSMDGFKGNEEVTDYLYANGIKNIHISPLGEAKHIFSHREWHMIGYMVKMDEPENGNPAGDTPEWIFIGPEENREKYPIPAAFAVYKESLEKYRETIGKP